MFSCRDIRKLVIFFLCCIALSGISSCSRSKSVEEEPDLAEAIEFYSKVAADKKGAADIIPDNSSMLANVIRKAELSEALAASITDIAAKTPAFYFELLSCLEGDPSLRRLVDKRHSLPHDYEPDDLVALGNAGGLPQKSFRVSRVNFMLRSLAADSLEEMAAAARADGVTLLVSSAYRSYSYQDEVYKRNVREMGVEAADRESARPGYSQHQTGLVVDFGSIDNTFAKSAAGLWMSANACRFGWSLSYPDGYEDITGYRWESWHYRYVGTDIAAFIDSYFNGIQQYALRFIYEWENYGNILNPSDKSQ